jgi:hypothetical protein
MNKYLIGKFYKKNNFLKKTIIYAFSAFSILFVGYILIAAINHFMLK